MSTREAFDMVLTAEMYQGCGARSPDLEFELFSGASPPLGDRSRDLLIAIDLR